MKQTRSTNVHGIERALNGIVGGWMVQSGLRRFSVGGTVLAAGGAALLARGLTGHCPVYQRLGVSTAGDAASRGVHLHRAMTVQLPPQAVYERLRQFHLMPEVLYRLEDVESLGDQTYRWTLNEGPVSLTCTTRITEDVPGQSLSWQTTEPSDFLCNGRVHVYPAPGDRGTELHIELELAPPGGRATAALAPLMRRIARFQLGNELHRLKQMMEAGEITTSAMRPDPDRQLESKYRREQLAPSTELIQ